MARGKGGQGVAVGGNPEHNDPALITSSFLLPDLNVATPISAFWNRHGEDHTHDSETRRSYLTDG